MIFGSRGPVTRGDRRSEGDRRSDSRGSASASTVLRALDAPDRNSSAPVRGREDALQRNLPGGGGAPLAGGVRHGPGAVRQANGTIALVEGSTGCAVMTRHVPARQRGSAAVAAGQAVSLTEDGWRGAVGRGHSAGEGGARSAGGAVGGKSRAQRETRRDGHAPHAETGGPAQGWLPDRTGSPGRGDGSTGARGRMR